MASNGTIVTKSVNRNGSRLKIRNPPKISSEEEKALRDQLHTEIANKTKTCSNIAYECSLPRIDGYDYCLRHILQDSHAPYKQCTFLLSNGKRCLQPAPKYDPKKDIFTSYCYEHSRLSQLTKTRTSIGKFKCMETNETILNELSHHINVSKLKIPPNSSGLNNISMRGPYDATTTEQRDEKSFVDPFYDINAASRNTRGRRILDYASDSSTDADVPTINNTWRGLDLDNSDNESIDSQNGDFLKHAEVYTTTEVTRITKQKLERLRSLYIHQLYRLKHVLREKRRNYLQSLRIERESLCSIYDQPKDSMRERKLYEKLKALNKYHKRNGKEAILYKKYLDKRQRCKDGVLPGVAPRTSFHTRCIFTEGGVKCGERIIPCSKYCKKHILEDKKQVLFRPCNIEKGGVVCQESVPNIFEDSTCILHIQLPVQRTYALKKYESESEEEATPKPSTSTASATLPVELKEEPKEEQTQTQTSSEQQKPEEPKTETTTNAQANPDEKEIKTESQKTDDVGANITICHDGIKQDDSDVIVLETTQTKPTLIHSESEVSEAVEE